MQDKRYQVFISSTFEDLRVERRAVQDVIISTGDFPVQMEAFPAADEDQFEFIKTLIDQCDYYILIIAGRYGAVSAGGLSYTHLEFRYAVSKGVPILVMLHGDRGTIPAERSEESSDGKKRLAEFISEAETGRLRKTWTTVDGLKLAVREALDNAKATKPRVGWVRGDAAASFEILQELNEVRKENERFIQEMGQLAIEVPLPSIPPASGDLELDLLPLFSRSSYGKDHSGSYAKLRSTWISIFPIYFEKLSWSAHTWRGEDIIEIDKDESCIAIGSAIAGELAAIDAGRLFKISEGTLDRLSSYYTEVGLMTMDGETPFTESAARIARRHRINGSRAELELLAGEVKVTSAAGGGEVDDEIPF